MKSKLEDDVVDMLQDGAVVLEPQEQFNKCIVGITEDGVLVYSSNLCIKSFMDQGMDEEEAAEFFHYNTVRAMQYAPKETRPIFLFAERTP